LYRIDAEVEPEDPFVIEKRIYGISRAFEYCDNDDASEFHGPTGRGNKNREIDGLNKQLRQSKVRIRQLEDWVKREQAAQTLTFIQTYQF